MSCPQTDIFRQPHHVNHDSRSSASPPKSSRLFVFTILIGLTACTNLHDTHESKSSSPEVSLKSAGIPPVSLAPDVANPNSIVVFPEQLVPTRPTSLEDTVSLNSALATFKSRTRSDDFSALESWVKENPSSPWAVAVLTNLGLFDYNAGYFSRAIEAYETAWSTGRHVEEYKAKLIVDRAIGELARMHALATPSGSNPYSQSSRAVPCKGRRQSS